MSPPSCIHLSTISSLSRRLEGWPLKCLSRPCLFCYGALSAPSSTTTIPPFSSLALFYSSFYLVPLLNLSCCWFFFIFEEDRTPRSSSWPSVFWLSGAHLQKALFTCLHWLLMSAFPIILYALHWLISLQILTAWLLCPPVLHSY